MTTLREQLVIDRDIALKARDTFRLGVLRMVIGDIQTAEKAGKTAVVFDDAAVITLLHKAVKQRSESAAIYARAGVTDRAESETNEARILSEYLPDALSADELAAIVNAEVEKQGATSRKQMGSVMKAVTAEVAGRAAGKEVSAAVMSRLS